MRYLFDTDHISVLQRKSGESYLRLTDRISRSRPDDFEQVPNLQIEDWTY